MLSPKLTTALTILAATGMRRDTYAPPLFRLLWRFGLLIPPPHFMSFGANFLIVAVGFGLALGAGMWLQGWLGLFGPQMRRLDAYRLVSLAIAGSLPGLCMATVVQYQKWRHKLPRWSELKGEQ